MISFSYPGLHALFINIDLICNYCFEILQSNLFSDDLG